MRSFQCLPALLVSWCVSFLGSSVGNPLRIIQSPGSPNNGISEAKTDLDSAFSNSLQHQHHRRPLQEGTRDLQQRTPGPSEGLELYHRYQQSAILPGVSSAAALKGFWQLISIKALYNNAQGVQAEHLFTITEGVLQATFSSLGHEFPWYFVQDLAMRLAGMVDRGWTDTFDMVFEQGSTGIMFWVSLRVLPAIRRRDIIGG